MHAAIVTPNLHGGGAEAIARQWIAELQAQGHTITVYAYGRRQPSVELPGEVVSHRLASRGGPLRPALMPGWLRARIREDKPDVVLSLMTFSNVITLFALKRGRANPVPLMVSEHNVQALQRVNVRRRDRLTVWIARRLYRYASGALAVSHPVAAELVSAFRVPADRVFVVPNPVVASRTAGDLSFELPAELHLALVGRLAKQKRPHLFLEVLSELAKRGVSVRASVIGDGPLRQSTEQEAARLGLNVSFLGWREPWWEAASDVDCLLLTANAEGLANVLVEAAAAGIPSVASSRALGVADAIVPGITGQLAPSDTPQAYADAVLDASALELRSEINLGAWLDRFSSAQSTATLLAALEAIR
ncbi:MAG: glycosyltransferase [Solirubrobacterales bacterium]|nr:glycosyltransferase [Solirubrobacterales bacterium]